MSNRKTDDEYIRERAEHYGLNIGDDDLAVIKAKWRSDALCNLDDLLGGLRRLTERSTAQMLAATKRMLQNSVERRSVDNATD